MRFSHINGIGIGIWVTMCAFVGFACNSNDTDTAPKDCRSETLSCAAGEVCLANDDGRYLCQPESFPDIDGSLVLDATTESDGDLLIVRLSRIKETTELMLG